MKIKLGEGRQPDILILCRIFRCHEQPAPPMQNTRLNNLLDVIASKLRQWFFNPWRRLTVIIISLLFGFFLGTAISTTAGQAADWDIVAAAILILLTEISSRIVYSRTWVARRSLWVESLNSLKIGVTYSLFIEAFKLGS